MSDMKTVNIKGKQYVEVNERLKYFREHFKAYSLLTEIIELSKERVVMKAKIINELGVEVANGCAYEEEGSTFINKTSYIENCETSAWGRALANFGVGIDSSVASADEVVNAINNQNQPDALKPAKKKMSNKKREEAELIQAEQAEIARLKREVAPLAKNATPEQLETIKKIKNGKENKDLNVDQWRRIRAVFTLHGQMMEDSE